MKHKILLLIALCSLFIAHCSLLNAQEKNIVSKSSTVSEQTINASAQNNQLEVERPQSVVRAAYFDKTLPLSKMKVVKPGSVKRNWKAKEKDEDENENVVPNKNLPGNKDQNFNSLPLDIDPVLQQKYNIKSDMLKAATTIMNFNGLAQIQGVYPPDTQGDVGTNAYMQITNSSFAIYSKTTGALLYGPADNSTMWAGFTGNWSSTNDGDGIILYDEHAQRWIFSQFSLPYYPNGPFYETIAISATSDPLGSWYRYAFQFTDMPDYPKFGVWSDGYYLSCNTFASGTGAFKGGSAAVFERDQMLLGNPNARMVFFGPNAARGGELPSDWDGPTAPPAGAPNYFTLMYSTTQLAIWALHVDWTNTVNSTFTNLSYLTVAAFSNSLCTGTNLCIPQLGSSQKLDALPDRLMYRLQYRNFGTYQTMVTNHTVNAGSGVAGIRWYELRNSGSGWSVYQQGTYSPDTKSRWMGSIAMNGNGDIALGFSVSSSSQYAGISYTGRSATTPLGQMSIPETQLMAGSGYQSGTYGRWGDYSMMSIDPNDDNTFWYTQEYIKTSGTANWATRISSFQLNSSSCTPVAVLTNPSNPAAVCAGTNVSNMSVSVSGTANYNYQWQINNSGIWTNLTTGGIYGTTAVTLNSSSASNTLKITNADATYNQKQYRCIITNCSGANTVTSSSATLTVNLQLAVSVSISAISNPVCSGSNAYFTAVATNGGTTPSYQWKVNGTNSGTNSSVFGYAAANNDVVTCVLTSNATCATGSPATSNPVTMTVNPQLSAYISITGPTSAICSGTSITFTAIATNGGTTPSYQWKVNGVNTGSDGTSFTSSALANNDIVTCVMTSSLQTCISNNPAASNSITMIVTQQLPVSASIYVSGGTTTFCQGTTIYMAALATNGGTSPQYQWKKNGIIILGETQPAYNTNQVANQDAFTVVLTSSETCAIGNPAESSPAVISIATQLPVSVSISAISNPVCSGSNAYFTAVATNGGTTPSYQWKVNGTNSGTNSSVFGYAAANNDVVTCVLTSNVTCATSNPATSNPVIMTVNPQLSSYISITGPTSAICSGTSVTFTAIATNGGTTPSYQWKVNGVNTGSDGTSFTSSALANNDVVTCVMTSSLQTCISNNPAASNSITMIVTQQLPVSASIYISGGTTTFCQGTTIYMAALATNGGTSPQYLWKKNGIIILGETQAAYNTNQVANQDAFTVVLTSSETCAIGNPAESSPAVITIATQLPVSVSISAISNPVCSGSNAYFTAVATNGGTTPSYQWKVNGTNSGTNSSVFGYAAANNDVVTCLLISNATCATGSPVTSNPVTMVVNNSLAAAVSIAANPAGAICSGTNVTFTATPTNGGSSPVYQWQVNGVIVGTSATYSSSSLSNNNLVKCIMTSNADCTTGSPATSNTITMSVSISPVPLITPQTSTTFCQGGSVVLRANTATGLIYQWLKNNTNISGATRSTYTANSSGSYTVLEKNTANCSATSAAVVVTVNPLPGATVTPQGSTTICQGTTLLLLANTGTGYTFKWRRNLTLISGATLSSYSVATSGTYSVIVSSSYGCSSTSSGVSVTVNSIPTASVTPTGPVNLLTGGSVTLKANKSNSLTYQWVKNGVNISGATTSSYKVTTSGIYYVKETNRNNCSANSNSVTVTVNGILRSVIADNLNSPYVSDNYPNPFNNTTLIDYYLPESAKVTLRVYNMLGQNVHTIVNEFQSEGKYTVTFNASGFGNGIYIYKIEMKGNDVDFTKTKRMILSK